MRVLLLGLLLQATGANYGWALLQALTALVAVALLAWLVLRFSLRGPSSLAFGRRGRHMTLLEQLPLDHRRSLYLVRVAERVLLLSTGEGGQLTAIAEFKEDELPDLADLAPPEGALFSRRRSRPGAQPAGGAAAARSRADAED